MRGWEPTQRGLGPRQRAAGSILRLAAGSDRAGGLQFAQPLIVEAKQVLVDLGIVFADRRAGVVDRRRRLAEPDPRTQQLERARLGMLHLDERSARLDVLV